MNNGLTWDYIYHSLAQRYPDARCSLDYQNPFQLLVATILSAQTTDARVNTVTPTLFSRWKDPLALAQANDEDVQQVVRPLGFQKRRAGQLVKMASALQSQFQGTVPKTRKELMTLAGVGRKTANVVLGNCFDQPALTVDTHVGRLSRRLEITTQRDPLKVEGDLARFFPPETWTQLCHLLIFHGRAVCQAKNPRCEQCPLKSRCPKILA